jgi:hypothetical protein
MTLALLPEENILGKHQSVVLTNPICFSDQLKSDNTESWIIEIATHLKDGNKILLVMHKIKVRTTNQVLSSQTLSWDKKELPLTELQLHSIKSIY